MTIKHTVTVGPNFTLADLKSFLAEAESVSIGESRKVTVIAQQINDDRFDRTASHAYSLKVET